MTVSYRVALVSSTVSTVPGYRRIYKLNGSNEYELIQEIEVDNPIGETINWEF